jgi:trehalose 6-phosphate phosphatase
LLGLDFDGTLSPIVESPELAQLDPATLPLLSSLRKKLGMVAVISGRDTKSLAELIPLDGIMLVGNHGMETRQDGESLVLPEIEEVVPRLEQAARALEELVSTPGVRVERKRAAVSIHYRLAAQPAKLSRELRPKMVETAKRFGLALQEGRMVFELRPRIAIDKGVVLTRLVESIDAEAIIYIGDDLTDVDAFRALRGMDALETLSVGVRSSESSAQVLEEADLLVDGVDGVRQFLAELDDRER